MGAVLSGLVALAVAVPVLRTRGIYLALATFALGQITRAVILNLEIIGGAAGYPVSSFIILADHSRFCYRRCRLCNFVFFGTRFGVAVRAVDDDERVADLMGVGVRGFQVAAFTLGAVIAGIGGGLYAHHFSYIEAQYFNVGLSITIVLYVLIGWNANGMGAVHRRGHIYAAAGAFARKLKLRYVGLCRRRDRVHGIAPARVY